MKLFWKILKYFAAISISIILILYILSMLFEKDISRIFIRELNKKTNAEVITGDIDFSLLKRFPGGSIEIDSFLLKSPQLNSSEIDNCPDTLLYADRIILTLEITRLLKRIIALTE